MSCYNIGEMDLLDKKLIEIMEQDAWQGSTILAKQLSTSSSTIRRRIANLIKNNVMRIVAVVDHNKIGLPLIAVIALHTIPEKLDSVAHSLFNRPEVTWISTTTGRFDIIFVARFSSTDELSNFIQNELSTLEGLKDSETFVCLRVLSWRDHSKSYKRT